MARKVNKTRAPDHLIGFHSLRMERRMRVTLRKFANHIAETRR